MSNKIEISKITIKIKDIILELTLDDAKALKSTLDSLFSNYIYPTTWVTSNNYKMETTTDLEKAMKEGLITYTTCEDKNV